MPRNDKAPAGIQNPVKLKDLATYYQRLGFQYSTRSYYDLATAQEADKTIRGYVDGLKATVQIAAHYKNKNEGRGDSTHEEIKKQRDLEKLEMEKMERRKMAETLISREEVSDYIGKHLIIFKTDLWNIPKRIRKWPEASEIVKKAVSGILRTYSRGVEKYKT